MIKARSNSKWPSGGLSYRTPDLTRLACSGIRGECGAQHAIEHIKSHPGRHGISQPSQFKTAGCSCNITPEPDECKLSSTRSSAGNKDFLIDTALSSLLLQDLDMLDTIIIKHTCAISQKFRLQHEKLSSLQLNAGDQLMDKKPGKTAKAAGRRVGRKHEYKKQPSQPVQGQLHAVMAYSTVLLKSSPRHWWRHCWEGATGCIICEPCLCHHLLGTRKPQETPDLAMTVHSSNRYTLKEESP